MKKTYEAPSTQGWTMGLNVRSNPISINFDPGQDEPEPVRNKFTTEDVDIQKAIESTKQFRIGSIKCIDSTEEMISDSISDVSSKSDKPRPIDPDTGEIKEVKETGDELPKKKELKYKSWQQVGGWLENNKGIDPKLLSSPEDIAKVAEEQGVSLLNLSL